MLVSTQSFLEPLEAWARAIRENDFAAAKRHAEHLTQAGELLVVHPDFQRCFAQHCGEVEPQDALVYLCQFLICATEGRARFLSRASLERS